MKYIDAEKLKEKIDEVRQDWLGDSTGLEEGESGAELGAAESILDSIDEIIDSLQQELKIWHNVSEEVPQEYGRRVLVACKNKNKEDGIWLYDLIQCWEGEWKPRVNWEDPVKWSYVDELGLNARKEE